VLDDPAATVELLAAVAGAHRRRKLAWEVRKECFAFARAFVPHGKRY